MVDFMHPLCQSNKDFHWYTVFALEFNGVIDRIKKGGFGFKMKTQEYGPNSEKVEKFIEEIKQTKFFKPDGDPKPEWKLFSGEDWNAACDAARNAARDAEWYAAWDAVRDSEWYAARNAARNSAGDVARYAARDSAGDAVWDTARDSADDAACDAARDAACDAALYAVFLAVSDLDFADKEKHFNHVKARWEVWTKGYALLCDVNGKLYVYAKK